jgi:hypothetical protein
MNSARQRRALLQYILAKMFTDEDLADQLQPVQEEQKQEAPVIQPKAPAPAPRFKALMEKMAQHEAANGESDGNSTGS